MSFAKSPILVVLAGLMFVVSGVARAVETPTVITAKTVLSAGPNDKDDKAITKTVQIGNATVTFALSGPNAFIKVTNGPLTLQYADGSPMCELPTGEVMQVSGFLGSGSGLTIDFVNGQPVVRLAPAVNLKVTLNNTGTPVTISQAPADPITIQPGKSQEIAAPVVTFTEGQTVQLKEGQVGKIVNGQTSLIAFGTDKGIAVTTTNPSAIISGAGTDQIVLTQNSTLLLTEGNLKVTNGGVSLTGNKVSFASAGGDITVDHNNQTSHLQPTQKITGTSQVLYVPPANPGNPTAFPPNVPVTNTNPKIGFFSLAVPTFKASKLVGDTFNDGLPGSGRGSISPAH